MIGFLSNEPYLKKDKINVDKLRKNMNIISKMTDIYSFYIQGIYKEYKDIFNGEFNDIRDELLVECKEITNKDIDKCTCIVSPSHLNTYHVIKKLNPHKEDVMVICFDMHCDTYDFDDLWKGNMFSKLLDEGYISYFMVMGVPKYKQKNTSLDVPEKIKDRVLINKNFKFKKVLKKRNPKRVFISIDIDVLNTRKAKYTSIDYCPYTVLEQVSKLDVINEEAVKNCVLIPNDLGYDNLYKIGENKLTVEMLVKLIEEIKKYCHKNGIILGFKDLYSDITEVVGNDYNFQTHGAIIKLLTILGGGTNEKTIRRES